MGSDCRQYFLVERNGDIYPCDFFVEPRLRLGNLMQHSWAQVRMSALYEDFGAAKSRYPEACQECAYLALCGGDCPAAP